MNYRKSAIAHKLEHLTEKLSHHSEANVVQDIHNDGVVERLILPAEAVPGRELCLGDKRFEWRPPVLGSGQLLRHGASGGGRRIINLAAGVSNMGEDVRRKTR